MTIRVATGETIKLLDTLLPVKQDDGAILPAATDELHHNGGVPAILPLVDDGDKAAGTRVMIP